MKEKIRPIYLELQGYLNSISKLSENSIIQTAQDWNNFHNAIDEISILTGNDYNKFKLKTEIGGNRGYQYQYVKVNNFKTQLSGLISKIYGTYFSSEKNPLDGSPSTVMTTTQNQNQSVKLEIAIEMTEFITKKLAEHSEGSIERKFFEQIKEGLKSGKGIVELFNLILSIGTGLGLTIPDILRLFSN